jgi:hypothetical protein
MKVRAIEKCFVGGSIRYPSGKVFDFDPGVDPITNKPLDFPSHILEIVDEKAPMPKPKKDNYASLSDTVIKSRLVSYMIKVPPTAKREALITLLAKAEGKTIKKKEKKK